MRAEACIRCVDDRRITAAPLKVIVLDFYGPFPILINRPAITTRKTPCHQVKNKRKVLGSRADFEMGTRVFIPREWEFHQLKSLATIKSASPSIIVGPTWTTDVAALGVPFRFGRFI